MNHPVVIRNGAIVSFTPPLLSHVDLIAEIKLSLYESWTIVNNDAIMWTLSG